MANLLAKFSSAPALNDDPPAPYAVPPAGSFPHGRGLSSPNLNARPRASAGDFKLPDRPSLGKIVPELEKPLSAPTLPLINPASGTSLADFYSPRTQPLSRKSSFVAGGEHAGDLAVPMPVRSGRSSLDMNVMGAIGSPSMGVLGGEDPENQYSLISNLVKESFNEVWCALLDIVHRPSR